MTGLFNQLNIIQLNAQIKSYTHFPETHLGISKEVHDEHDDNDKNYFALDIDVSGELANDEQTIGFIETMVSEFNKDEKKYFRNIDVFEFC